MYRRRIGKSIVTLVFFLFELSNIVQTESENDILEWTEPASCTKKMYFDTDSVKCKNCPNNLVSSADGLQCVCDRDSKIIAIKNGYPVCDLCETGKIRTIDGNECISCPERGGICDCSGNEIRIERNWNGTILSKMQCLSCPKNTFSSSDHSQCLPCFSDAITSSGGCNDDFNFDDSSSETLREYCMPKDAVKDWPDVRNTYLVKFKKNNVDSYFFRKELRFAVYSCENGVQRACRQLANMCALTLFTDSIPCEIFMRKNEKPSRLFYRQGEAPTVLNRRTIAQRYTLDQRDPSNKLILVAAAFGLEGHLESISQPDLPCMFFGALPFGINLLKECKISAINLQNEKMRFFIPYLSHFDKDNEDKRLLHPLPILVKNNLYSENDDIARWQLVGRFFSIDKITGYSAVLNLENATFTKSPEIQVLRYLKSMNLVVKLQKRNERGKIFPPLLVVEYDELTNREILENIKVSIKYKVTYSLPDDETSSVIEVFIAVLASFAIGFSAIKAWSHSRRDCDSFPSIATLMWFIVYCFGSIGNILIVVCSGACIYTFVFYKGQKVAHILLPSDANEWTIRICIIVAFAFKTAEILALIYEHRRNDIFFIDWEQPRIMDTSLSPIKYDSPRTSLRKCYKIASRFNGIGENVQSEPEIMEARRNKAGPSKSASRPSTPSRRSINDKILHERDPLPAVFSERNFSIEEHEYESNNSTVGIWRTCIVANEWLKIKTKRKTNILLQIIASLFILEIVGAKYWSIAVPELRLENDDRTLPIDQSFTLEYAVGIFVYLVVYSAQWSFSVFINERYIKNQLQEFIDLCSMANISVFILSHDYYGYYIHGRSVHGFADTDLLTLINDLKREENNLCAHRGLIPGTIEQTFVISVSKTFRTFYDRISGSQNSSDGKFLRKNLSNLPDDWDKRWRTRSKLSKFLTGFLDHCYKNVDYTIKERHFFEKMCDLETAEVAEKSIFYIVVFLFRLEFLNRSDNAYSFDRTIFHGNEWTLATFEISVFLLVLVLHGDYILASLATLLAEKAAKLAARFNGKRLLARKTLIDERFLVS